MPLTGTLYKVTTKIAKKSAVDVDSAQFSIHVKPTGVFGDSQRDDVRDQILAFLNDVEPVTATRVVQYLSKSLSDAVDGVEVSFYQVPAAPGPLGAPVGVKMGQLLAVGTTSLPSEVAGALSFRSSYGSAVEFGAGTRPRSRLRNRFYLGPLSQTAVLDDANFEPRPKPAFITCVSQQAKTALLDDMTALGVEWRVFSPTVWTDYPVDFVSMDNALDTQRRRGPSPTTRTELAV